MKKERNMIVIDFFGEKCNVFDGIKKNILSLYPHLLIEFNTYNDISQIRKRKPKALIIDDNYIANKDWFEIEKVENSLYPEEIKKFIITSEKINKDLRNKYALKGAQFIYSKGNNYDIDNIASNILASIHGGYRIKERYVYAPVERSVRVNIPAKLEKFNETNLVLSSKSKLNIKSKFILHNELFKNLKVGKENIVKSLPLKPKKDKNFIQSELRLVSSEEIMDYEKHLRNTEFIHMEKESKEKVITDTLKAKLKDLLLERSEQVEEYKKANILQNKDSELIKVLIISKDKINYINKENIEFHFSYFFNEELFKEIKPDIVIMDYEFFGNNEENEPINNESVIVQLNQIVSAKDKINFVLTNSRFDDKEYASMFFKGFLPNHTQKSISKDLIEQIVDNLKSKIDKRNNNSSLSFMKVKDPVFQNSEIEINTEILKISEEAIIFCGKEMLPENQILRIEDFEGISFNVTVIHDEHFHEKNGYYYQIGLINGLSEKERDYLRSFNISYKDVNKRKKSA